MTPAPILSLPLTDILSIVAPILGTLAFTAKYLVRSIDRRLETHAKALEEIQTRCARNHPATPPDNGVSQEAA